MDQNFKDTFVSSVQEMEVRLQQHVVGHVVVPSVEVQNKQPYCKCHKSGITGRLAEIMTEKKRRTHN